MTDSNNGFYDREVQESAFATLFQVPQNAASLYNALEDGPEVSPRDIQYLTLADVLFKTRKNDMAFTVGKRALVISEHQSTLNENMPLRDAIYYGRIIEKLTASENLYKNKRIRIPVPEFYVLYNGVDPYPPEKTLRLSDLFMDKREKPMLELKVKVININFQIQHEVLQKCRPLYEYAWFIQRIREYELMTLSRDAAVRQAVKDCHGEGYLEDFLREHGPRVGSMLFTEFRFNMEDALRVSREEGMEEGEIRRLIRIVCRKLAKGMTPAQIAEDLEEEEELITQIGDIAGTFAPAYNMTQIYQAWWERQ